MIPGHVMAARAMPGSPAARERSVGQFGDGKAVARHFAAASTNALITRYRQQRRVDAPPSDP